MTLPEQIELENHKNNLEKTRRDAADKAELTKQFKIEQFKSLRSEIEETFRNTRTLELYVVGGLVAYYAWIMTHCLPDISIPILYYPLQWLIPIGLPVLGLWRTWENMIRLGKIARFMHATEDDILSDATKGWEHFLITDKTRWDLPGSYWAVWGLMILACIIIPPFGRDLNWQTCIAIAQGTIK
jgi:hypothetical protein